MSNSAGRLDNFTDAAFAFAGPYAAFAYSTLPLSIGLFSSRHDWTGGGVEE